MAKKKSSAVSAESMGKKQREISVSEFFLKNRHLLGFDNPLFYNSNLGFFMRMIPFILIIVALVIGSQSANRKRLGAPAALGLPYIRGERGL